MLTKFTDVLIIFIGISICIPVCFAFWIVCIDYTVDKIKELF